MPADTFDQAGDLESMRARQASQIGFTVPIAPFWSDFMIKRLAALGCKKEQPATPAPFLMPPGYQWP